MNKNLFGRDRIQSKEICLEHKRSKDEKNAILNKKF